MNYYIQDPDETVSYQQEVSAGDTISSTVWTISPAGPTIGTPTNTATTSTVKLSGLSPNVLYTLTVRITGASGQIRENASKIKGQHSYE